MATNSAKFVFSVVCLLACCALGQGEETTSASHVPQNISNTCIGCICHAATGCNTSAKCHGDVCGPFAITWAYWYDGGEPTLNDEPNTAEGAYERCVNNALCAARAVRGYMKRYATDCNGDGIINCDDYVRIHRHGPYGCSSPFDAEWENNYRTCAHDFGV